MGTIRKLDIEIERWLSDRAVQACSLAARGLWWEMLLRMAKGKRYGVLEDTQGKPLETHLCKLVSARSQGEVKALLFELEANEVFSRDDEGVPYCRGMIRKEKKKTSAVDWPEEAVSLTDRLLLLVRAHKNVKHSAASVFASRQAIMKMHDIDGIDYERVENAMRWYEEHFADQYVPVIACGASLRAKFLRLEAAVARETAPWKKDTKRFG